MQDFVLQTIGIFLRAIMQAVIRTERLPHALRGRSWPFSTHTNGLQGVLSGPSYYVFAMVLYSYVTECTTDYETELPAIFTARSQSGCPRARH